MLSRDCIWSLIVDVVMLSWEVSFEWDCVLLCVMRLRICCVWGLLMVVLVVFVMGVFFCWSIVSVVGDGYVFWEL